MVAIVSGSTLGINNSSLARLGQQGIYGSASQGSANEGAYVDVANGNLILQDLDNQLAGIGGGISTLRTYNSEGALSWRIGAGSQSLSPVVDGQTYPAVILVNNADGSQRAFNNVGGASYAAADLNGGVADTLVQQADGTYVLTDGSTGAKQIYAGSGSYHLLASIDANGNTTTYTYGSNGLLASVTDANGETVYYDYDASNNLIDLRSVVGNGTSTVTSKVVSYTYDAQNRLTSVTTDLSPLDNSTADGNVYTTSYTYDGSSNRVASVTQSDGTHLSFTYVQVNGNYEVASVTDGDGATTTFSYDPNNLTTIVTDGAGNVTTYQYDNYGHLTNVLADSSAGGTTMQSTPVSRFTYDNSGRLLQSWNAGTVTQYTYGGTNGPLTGVTQWQAALGATVPGSTPLQSNISYTVAANGKVLTSTVYQNPGSVDGSVAASGPLTTRYVYDANGNLLFQLSPSGDVTQYVYAGNGLLQSKLVYSGSAFNTSGYAANQAPSAAAMAAWVAAQPNLSQVSRTDFGYDARGELASTTTYGATLANGTGDPATASVTHYVYSPSGELLSIISPTGQQSSTTYDGLGRVLSQTDAEGHVTVTQYDDAQRSVSVTAADGTQTITVRDAAGRVVSIAQISPSGQALGTTIFQYDADGRLLMTQDPTGVRTYSLYDDLGHKVADIDGNGVLTQYTRDIDGRVTSQTVYATPVNVALLVDASGNAVNPSLASVLPTATASDQTSTFRYDAEGRLVETVSPAGIATVTVYDGASRILSQTTYATPVGASGIPVASASDRTVRHFYDADGNLAGTIDATGALTVYSYDAANRLVRTTQYANAALNPAAGDPVLADYIPAADPQHDISTYTIYDARGEVVGQIDGDGYLTETVYDASGNPTRQIRYATAVSYTLGETLAAVRPASTPRDQVTQRTYTPLNQVATQTAPNGTVTQYVYDSLGRLVTTVSAAGTADVRTLTERYDAQGRLIGELTGNGSAQLAQATTQAQIDAVWAQYGITYTYDAAGRRTSATDADGHRTVYFYDADGRLTASVDALGEVTQTEYDAFGRVTGTIRYGTRINASALSGGVMTAGVSAQFAALRNPQLDATTTITYNLDGTEASSTDANGNVTSFTYDAFGDRLSTTRQIDPAHTLVTDYGYDADGRVTSETDDATGLAAVTATRYDAFGRVIGTTDPAGNVRSYQYDRDGNQIASTDALGNTTSVAYDAFGRVVSRTDALGATTTYSYNDATRTTVVTTPEGIQLSTVVNEFGQTQTVTDGDGNATQYSYDANGNLTGVSTALSHTSSSYDAANNLISTTDANGVLTTYSYDATNRLLARVVDPNGLKLATLYQYDALGREVSTTDPTGVVTVTRYDLDGQTLSQTVDPSGLNLTTSYTYDGLGRTLTVTSPGGTVTQYQYDGLGRRVSQTLNPGGLNLTTTYRYDADGNLLASTDPNGQVSLYAYDADNRQIYAVDPTGAVTQTRYDADGRITSTTTYATPISTAALTPSAAAIAARVAANAARDDTQYRVYDADGRLTWTVDGSGAATSRTYDGAGNVVRLVTYANRVNVAQLGTPGAVPQPVVDVAHDRVTQTVYDAQNRAVYTLDATGAVTETDYDAAGNVVQSVSYATRISPQTAATQTAIAAAVAGVANPAADKRVRNVYDTAGRLTYSANGVGAVTRFIYDGDGRVVRTIAYATTIAASASPASVTASVNDRTSDRVYDTAGRLEWTVDAGGDVSQNIYDANGNVIQTIAYATPVALSAAPYTATTLPAALYGDTQNDRVTTFAYDSANRQVLSIDALGDVTQITYDAAGHVLSKTQYAQPLASGSLEGASLASLSLAALSAQIHPTPSEDRTTRYVYDADGRQRYAIDPLGYVTETRYDGLGNIVATTAYALAVTLNGNPTTAQVAAALTVDPGADRTSTFTYNASGELVASTDGLGYTETYTYDGTGNKLSNTNKDGYTWTYDYDAAGDLIRQTSPQVLVTSVQAGAGGALSLNWSASATTSVVTTYAYNAYGQVVAMTEALGRPEQRTTQYVYDAAGRQIRTIYPPVNVYAAPYDNLAANGQSGLASRVEYTNVTLSDSVYYNAFGDAVANVDTGGNVSLKSYDKLGQVTYAVDGDGYVTGYTHDAFGDVTRLVRFAQATSLPGSLASALQADTTGSAFAFTSAQVSAVVNAASVNHGADRAVQTSYDRLGRAVQVVDPQSYVYDSAAPAGAQYFTAGKTTRTTYDAFGEAIQTSALVNPLTNAWNVTTQYFDQDGRNIASVDPLGYVTTRSFDASGNLVRQTEYANATNSWNLSAYATPAASAQDRTTVYTYDADNRKTSQTQVNATYSTASNGTSTTGNLTTRYTYDGVGNLTSTTTPDGTSTISYYDALGRVTAVAQGNTAGAGAAAPLTEYYRDAYGNILAEVQHAQGSNYATLQGYSAISSGADRVTYNEYNSRGDAIETTDADGNSMFSSYTADDHLAKEWQAVTGVDGSTHTWFEAYQYDADGNRTAVIDPASTSVLQSGVTTSFSSSNPVSYPNQASVLNGTNSITVNWSSLVNPTGGAVRVDVYYNTASTLTQVTVPVGESGTPVGENSGPVNEDGVPETVGSASQPASRSQTYAASQAQGGVTMSWNDQYSSVGGISQLTYVRVWQQDAAGNWQVLWEGSNAQANGSGIAQVSQQQAGVDVARTSYDAFGDVVSKGMDGGSQVYYDYDNAGNLWKTNSGNGTDTIYLYDLAGDRTAAITSAGSASDNINLQTIVSEDQAAALTDVRRTDTVYNALGYAIKVIQPEQTVVYGGAQVGNIESQAAIASSATFVPNGNGGGTWYGNNQVNVSWPSLAGLGNGDIKVQLSYYTQGASAPTGGAGESGGVSESGSVDESGQPTAVTIPQTLESVTQIFTAAQANGGTVLNWSDPSSSSAGGVSQIAGMTVWKKDANGQWQQVFNQSVLNQNGSYIAVSAPPDASTNVALQIAPAGSGQWQTVPPSQLVDFGDQYRFDASSLGYGSYDFRVLTTPAGGQAAITGQGTVTIGTPQVAPIDIPMGFNNPGTPTGMFSWPAQAGGTLTVFNYKVAGSNSWQTLPVTDLGNGMDGVDMSSLPPGQYQYEVLYIHNGQWQAFGHSTGNVAVTAPVAPRYVPPVGLPVITAPISIGAGVTGGEWQVGTDEGGAPIYDAATPSGATATNVLHWTDTGGQTAVFQYQLPGSSTWVTLPVTAGLVNNESGLPTSVDESGNAVTDYGVDIGGLPPGNYNYQVLYYQPGQSSPDAHATGNLSIGSTVPGHWQTQYTTVSVPYTVFPPPPSNYITGHDASGAPVYGAPVVVGNNGSTPIFGQGYTGGPAIVAVPYTEMVSEQQQQSVYVDGHYTTQYTPVTVTPPDPSNYIIGTDESGAPIYGPPVVVGTTESGSPIYGQGYEVVGAGINESGAQVGGTVVAIPYTTQQAQNVWVPGYWTTQTVTVQVPVTVNPPPASNYITGYDESGTPTYGPPVVTSYNEDGSANLGQGYVMSPVGNVEAVPYTAYQQETRATNVWIPPVTSAPSVSENTPPYQPGYTIPGQPTHYYSGDTTGSTPYIQSMGSGGVGEMVSGSASGAVADSSRPVINETVDRWGNVLTESDPRAASWITQFSYNQNNQLVSTVQTSTDGAEGAGATTQIYYDALGRQVATRDGNGNVNGLTYDAQGDVTAELHADGGVVRYTYDALGEKTSMVDALGLTTLYGYDHMGRLISTEQANSVATYNYNGAGSDIQLVSNGPLTERIAYDQRGDKIAVTDAAGETTEYEYDMRGDVTETIAPGGAVTRDAYDAEGHKVAEVDADNNAATWKYDYFGELLSHVDIGGAQYSYNYDNARQLTLQTNTRGQYLAYNYDVAGHVTQIYDGSLGQTTQYAYDASGNRIREVTSQGGVIYQDNHLAYDALGRLREVQDGNVNIVYTYDANGNRTQIHTEYLNTSDGNEGSTLYFAYDSMNRETVADAYDANHDISGTQGHYMAYDLDGNRISDTSIGAVLNSSGGKTTGVVTQKYTYDALNRLVTTTYNGTLIDDRFYDADSRVVRSGPDGTPQSFFDTLGLTDQIQLNQYDGAGRLLYQRNYNANMSEQDYVSYNQYDNVGNVIQYQETNTQGNQYTNTYTNTLVRYENYEISSEHGTSTVLQSGTTNYQYDVNGNLTGLTDTTDSVNNRSFVNDASGQILQKTQGSSVERELIANDQLVGTTGTGTSPDAPGKGNQPNFVDLTNFDPTYKPINSNYPAPTPGAYTVNAGDSLESIAQGAYGDSKLWYLIADANGLSGDKDLRVGQTLNIPNQVGDVHNSAGDFRPYDASTVVGGTQPNLPQPPADSAGGCGAILGIIILVIVVVVTAIAQQYEAVPGEVAAEGGAGAGVDAGIDAGVGAGMNVGVGAGVDAGLAGVNSVGLGTFAAGGGASLGGTLGTAAAIGAAADAAGQLVGDALGTHQGFDLLETLEAAGTSMILPDAPVGFNASAIGQQALRGALANAATQGVRLALHQQDSFNWSQVALSAAAAPLASAAGNEVGSAVGNALGNAGASQLVSSTLDRYTTGMVSNTVTTLATGGKVDLASIAADAFGNALGQDLMGQAFSSGQQDALAQAQSAVMQSSDVGMPGDAVMFGPLGAGAALPSGDGYTDAVYNQMVGAFSDAQGSYSSAPGVLVASNDLASGVVTDAGSDMPTVTLPTIYVTPNDSSFGNTAAGAGEGLSITSQDPITGAITWNTGAVSYPVAPDDVTVTPLPDPAAGPDLVDRLEQSFAGTAKGLFNTAVGAARFVNDQGWVAANALTGGWLAANNSDAAAAVQRNTALGQAMLTAPGVVAGYGMAALNGNISFDDIGQGISNAWQTDKINQLEAAGNYTDAQAIRTQNVIGVASLVAGGAGLATDAASAAADLAQTAKISTALAVDDFASSRTGQMVAASVDRIAYQAGLVSYVVPPAAGGVAGLGTDLAGASSIGSSGYASMQELSDAAFAKYQGFVDDGYSAAQQALENGKLQVPSGVSRNTVLGQFTDQYARTAMSEWLDGEGIGEGAGESVQLNRYLYDPAGSGSYRIPDVSLPGANQIYDATLGFKSWSTPQIRGFYQYSGGSNITIVRPTQLGGSYSVFVPH
jgi:YD repeat-containing protein